MLLWEVSPPEGDIFGDATIVTNVKPGVYRYMFEFTANPGKHEPFVPGIYSLGVGTCAPNPIVLHSYCLCVCVCVCHMQLGLRGKL
jgi:hypothetical protein